MRVGGRPGQWSLVWQDNQGRTLFRLNQEFTQRYEQALRRFLEITEMPEEAGRLVVEALEARLEVLEAVK